MKYTIKQFLQSAITVGALYGTASGQLIHHWMFDEGSGDTALDSAGANPGVITGAVYDTDTIRGTFLSFNGTSDVVNPSLQLPAMDLVNDFTWAAWVNSQAPASAQPNPIILGNRGNGSGERIDFTPREFIKMTPQRSEYRPMDISQNTDYTDPPIGTWVHLTVVKDGDVIQTFFNGVPQGNSVVTNEFANIMPFFIGGETGQPTAEFFNGFIDDVRLYQEALTPEAVQEVIGDTPQFPFFFTNPVLGNSVLFDTPFGGSLVESAFSSFEAAPTFAKVSGPDWLTVAADGTLSGTPPLANVGLNNFVVSVTNEDGTTEGGFDVLVSAPAAPLLAGWDQWSPIETGVYDANTTSMVTAQVVGTITQGAGNIGPFNNAGVLFGASLDGSWGSIPGQDGVAAANMTAENSMAAVALPTRADGTFDFTITASEGTGISFSSFNFDSFRRFGSSSDTWTLSVLSGDITNGPIANATGSVTQASGGTGTLDEALPNDFDIDLTVLEDRILDAGESAVFRLEFTGANPGTSGGNITSIDNVGIFGETVASAGSNLALTVANDGDNLTFTWNSSAGQIYNLRSETNLTTAPITWPIFGDNMDIAATPPTNTLTVPRSADARRFFIIEEFEAVPETIISEDFEGDGGGFTASVGAGSAWEQGAPNSSGFNLIAVTEGNNGSTGCWGTDITDPAALIIPTTDSFLRSPDIDLTGSSTASLSFAEAIDFSIDTTGVVNLYDSATDALLGTIYTAVDAEPNTSSWAAAGTFDLSAGLGLNVYLQWELDHVDGIDFIGWYIDDVVVTGN